MGDSAALFAYVPPKRKTALEVQALTEDHRLTNPSERRRLAGVAQAQLLLLLLSYRPLAAESVHLCATH